MSDSKPIFHGGNPAKAEARFGVPAQGWVDLSTGINPVAYAPGPLSADVLHRLPLAKDLDALLSAARAAYNVPNEAAIVASPGTQALIGLVPTLLDSGDVSILSPTYGEHAPAWTAAGHRVEAASSMCAQAVSSAPYAVLVHPNNPDGKLQAIDGMLGFADELHERGGCLVVDEAFADVMPERSVTPHAGRDGLIVLRSFGKFYGLAGVRLGFAVCAPEMAERIAVKLGPWAVSGPAIWAGTKGLNDDAWADASRARLKADAARLDDVLQAAGLSLVGGTDLFRLVESPDAEAVFETLARAGILVRPFPDHPTWLRFGLPGNEAAWTRLSGALSNFA